MFFCCSLPYGAPEHRKALGEHPEGVARRDARDWPTSQDDSLGQRRDPKPEARNRAPSRRLFLSSISFGRTKEMYPGCRGGATRNYVFESRAKPAQFEKSGQPVLQPQAGYTREFLGIVGDQNRSQAERVRGDQGI